jgi:hypothetical protein
MLSLSRMNAIAIGGFIFFLGAANYLVQSFLPVSAPSHLFFVWTIAAVIASLHRGHLVPRPVWQGCGVLSIWLALALVSVVTMSGRGSEYQIAMLIGLWIGTYVCATDEEASALVIKIFTAQIFMQLLFVALQLRFLQAGNGLKPNYDQNGLMLLTGSFNNPNDLACVTFSTYVAITLFGRELLARWLHALVSCAAFLIIFVALSRTVLVLHVIYTLLLLVTRVRSRGLAVGVGAVAVAAAAYFAGVDHASPLLDVNEGVSAVSRSLDRLSTLNDLTDDNSVLFRLNALSYFVEHFGRIGLGSQVEGDYSWFFQGAPFDTTLMAFNPHSFVIENALWLGYPGFLIAVSWILLLVAPIVRDGPGALPMRVFLAGALPFLTTVPSSVFGDSYFWVPWIFMCAQALRTRTASRPTQQPEVLAALASGA